MMVKFTKIKMLDVLNYSLGRKVYRLKNTSTRVNIEVTQKEDENILQTS